MHGELVPVELETGMLEVRKMMGTTEQRNMQDNVTVSMECRMQNMVYE